VGSVLILLSEGREQDSYKRALDNYAVMQKKIASGNDFTFPVELSPRILPKDIDPQPEKRHIDIPIENTQPEPPRKRAAAKKKAPPKKFFMPEGVKTGFTKASRIGKPDALSTDSSGGESEGEIDTEEPLVPVLDSSLGLLTDEEQATLHRNYIQDFSGEGAVMLGPPVLEKFPEEQRNLTPTNLVGHGEFVRRYVDMVRRMYRIDDAQLEHFKETFEPELLRSPKKTTAFKPVRPATSKPRARKMTNDTQVLDDDDDVVITHVSSVKSAQPAKSRTATRGKLGKRKPHILSDDSEGDEVLTRPKQLTSTEKRQKIMFDDDEYDLPGLSTPTAKRQKAMSDDDEYDLPGLSTSTAKRQKVMSDDDEYDLPDAKQVLQSFRWAGSGRQAR
jgi:ATP-dependent DNA helicase MPH1